MVFTKKSERNFVDLIPENELQEHQIRDIAQNGVEQLQLTLSNLHDNTAAMARWILASLLAVNTAGAAGVLSASDRVVGNAGHSVLAFSIGAILAILTGINGLLTAIRISPAVGDSIEQLRLSVIEGKIMSFTRARMLEIVSISRQQIILSASLTTASLLAFGVGIATAVL